MPHTFTLENAKHLHLAPSILPILKNWNVTWHKPEVTSKASFWALIHPPFYRVNDFLSYNSHNVYILFSEIDLHPHPSLRLLQFNLDLDRIPVTGHDEVIQWFSSICKSVTSTSFVVEVDGLPKEFRTCNTIQEALLALYRRTEIFSVRLPRGTKVWGLFSRLYEADIVIEEGRWLSNNEEVSSISS